MKTNWRIWATAGVIAVGTLTLGTPSAKAQGFSFGFSTGPNYYGGAPLLLPPAPIYVAPAPVYVPQSYIYPTPYYGGYRPPYRGGYRGGYGGGYRGGYGGGYGGGYRY